MSAPGRATRRPGLGIALILLMSACFATMDTAVKVVGAFVPVLVILSARYGVQAAAMAVWLAASSRRGGAGFRAVHPRFQLARGALLLTSSAFAFLGLQHLPVAEFTAIAMLTPVMVTLLSGWLLHERVSPLRWALVVGGFCGALIVIRPGSGLFGWAVLLPLASAVAYASFQVLTRKLSGLESPYTTHFYTGLVGSLVVAALLLASPIELLPFVQSAPADQLALLLLIGALGTLGHLLLVLAFGLAPTATLMPMLYAQLAFAAAVAWLVFRHAPDAWGWLGMGVVAACGAASAWLNVREAAAARQPLSAVGADTITD
jgi:drug/metabolite transporter (DMT)-like permease